MNTRSSATGLVRRNPLRLAGRGGFCGDDGLVVTRPGRKCAVAAVANLIARKRALGGADRDRACDGARELVVVHESRRVRVVEQVRELVFDVSVVDVDRNAAEELRGKERLEILG